MTRPRKSSSGGVALVVCHDDSKDLKRHRERKFDLKATSQIKVERQSRKDQEMNNWQTQKILHEEGTARKQQRKSMALDNCDQDE